MPTPGYNIQSLFRTLPQHTVARRCAKSLELPQNGFLRGNQPYVLGDLTIDYALRRVSLAVRPVQMTAIEYRTLAELSANAGRVLTYEHLLRRVWRLEVDADLRPMRTAISSLRRKLGNDAEDPTYIFTELRVGYRMPKGETPEYVETSGECCSTLHHGAQSSRTELWTCPRNTPYPKRLPTST